MTIREFREKVNLRLYKWKKAVTFIQRSIVAVVSLTAFFTLIYYYGYPQTVETKETLISIFKFSFAVYIFNYLLKFIFDFEPRTFIKRTWFEGSLMLFLIIEGLSYNLFDTLLLSTFFMNLGVDITTYTNVLIQVYFLIVVIYEAGKSSNILPKIKLHPSNIFMASFLILILSGAGLLMLPEMSIARNGLNFVDALFMSTSATCVTGLATIDISSFLTFKGQVIILFLVKLGGINVIAFGSFVALVAKFGMGIKQHTVLEDFVNRDSIFSAKGILQKIIIWSFTIETVGVILFYILWNDALYQNEGDRLFSSIFHSLSAFNNAGLTLFTDGYADSIIRTNYAIHNITTVLMFLGALGFVAIFDIFSWHKIKERFKFPWKSFSLGTKISLYFSVGLVLFGWFFFYMFEAENILDDSGFFASMSHSLFHSVSARSSGFNTLDTGSFTLPSLLMIIFLMFIGGSSSSTAGGIKTSTFAVLWASVISTIRGREHAQIFKKTLPNTLVFKALSILSIYMVLIMLAIIILTLTETRILSMPGRSVVDIIFEGVSAFTTTGLSTGITPYLSVEGKVILTISMFVGRVGMLTVAYAIGKEAISKRYKYPKGHTMIG